MRRIKRKHELGVNCHSGSGGQRKKSINSMNIIVSHWITPSLAFFSSFVGRSVERPRRFIFLNVCVCLRYFFVYSAIHRLRNHHRLTPLHPTFAITHNAGHDVILFSPSDDFNLTYCVYFIESAHILLHSVFL